jgi:hypothetical protein
MFGSESELVQTLIDAARAAGYQVHPELGSWDTLIVCRETGDQIGVQAKLRPTVEVFSQALSDEHGPGPEIHAVLVPVAPREFLKVAFPCNVHVFQGVHLDRLDLAAVFSHAPRWGHPVREWAPEVEMRFPAGVPSPRRMTPWKLAAVKLCLLAREQGYVTREDMKRLKLNPHWWLSPKEGRVLEPRIDEHGNKRRGEYSLRDSSSPMVPDLRWPEIVDALQQGQALVEPLPQIDTPKGPRLRKRRPPPAPEHRSTMLPPPPPLAAIDFQLKPLAAMAANTQEDQKGRLIASGK